MKILVTGGTGTLGTALVPRLVAAGLTVRVTSRRPGAGAGGIERVRVDLAAGDGIEAAVAGTETVIHLASATTGSGQSADRVDVAGTERLLAASAAGGVRHFHYVSIVGIDAAPFGYYRRKLAAEELIRDGGVPFSILRATQFHTLIDKFVGIVARLPVVLLDRRILVQPVDVGEAADRVVHRILDGPTEAIENFGGPEVLRADDLVRQWSSARRVRRWIIPARTPGKVGAALRAGALVTATRPTGRITWARYLADRYLADR